MSILPTTEQDSLTIDNVTTADISALTIKPLDDYWVYSDMLKNISTVPSVLSTDQMFVLQQNGISNLATSTISTISGTGHTHYSRISTIKYIIAGTKEEYEAYIAKKGLSSTEYVFLYDASILEDMNNVHGYYVGSWRDREDINEIKKTIVACNMRF